MGVSSREKMELLFEQIQFPEELAEEHMGKSSLKKLDVFTQTKTWHFHFQLECPLPPSVYQLFTTKLQEGFRHIAEVVDWTMHTDQQSLEEQDLLDYWKCFVTTVPQLSPAYKDLVLEQQPEINGNKIMLTCRNEAESHAVRKRLHEPLLSFCKKVGITPCVITTKVKSQEEEIKKFQQERQKEDQLFVQQAVKEKEERATQQSES